MTKTLITAAAVFAITLSGTAAQARGATYYQDGDDLLIVNNGDGSDFFVPIDRWFSWMPF